MGLSVKEKKFNIDIQSGGRGGRPGVPIGRTLAIINLQGAAILATVSGLLGFQPSRRGTK